MGLGFGFWSGLGLGLELGSGPGLGPVDVLQETLDAVAVVAAALTGRHAAARVRVPGEGWG